MINKKDELTLSKAHYPDFFGLMSRETTHHLCWLNLPAHTDKWSAQADVMKSVSGHHAVRKQCRGSGDDPLSIWAEY